MFSTLLIINSKDRNDGDSGNFNYIFQVPFTKIRNFKINKIVIPYSFYATVNQQIVITSPSIGGTINVPAGNYTADSLATTLEGLINSSFPIITCSITYSSITDKYTFTGALPYSISSLGLIPPNNNLMYQLGLTSLSGVQTVLPQSANFVSTYCANLSGTCCLYVSSNALRLFSNSSFQNMRSNIIQVVPIQVNSFNYIVWQNSVPTYYQQDEYVLNQIDLRLIDDFGNTINLNGLDWSIEIEISGPNII